MTILSRVLAPLAAVCLLPIACSGGGGGGAAAGGSGGAAPLPLASDWPGDWDIVATQTSTTCTPNPNYPVQTLTTTFTLTTANGVTTASFLDPNIQIPLNGSRIQGYSPWNLSTYDFQLTGKNTFAGTQTSKVGGCEVVFAWTGKRVGS